MLIAKVLAALNPDLFRIANASARQFQFIQAGILRRTPVQQPQLAEQEEEERKGPHHLHCVEGSLLIRRKARRLGKISLPLRRSSSFV